MKTGTGKPMLISTENCEDVHTWINTRSCIIVGGTNTFHLKLYSAER